MAYVLSQRLGLFPQTPTSTPGISCLISRSPSIERLQADRRRNRRGAGDGRGCVPRLLRPHLGRRCGDISPGSAAIASSPTICCRKRIIACCARTSAFESEAHRRNYLYRIATNLVRDSRRQRRPADEDVELASLPADRATRRCGSRRRRPTCDAKAEAARACASVAGLRARLDRTCEIADVLGLKTGSVKLLLFRARRRMAALLRGEHRHIRGTTVKPTVCEYEADVWEAVASRTLARSG